MMDLKFMDVKYWDSFPSHKMVLLCEWVKKWDRKHQAF